MLYENALWKLREGKPDDYEYQRQLVQLLLAYGGKSATYGYTWRFKDPKFEIKDLKDLNNYQAYLRKVSDKHCLEEYIINTDIQLKNIRNNEVIEPPSLVLIPFIQPARPPFDILPRF